MWLKSEVEECLLAIVGGGMLAGIIILVAWTKLFTAGIETTPQRIELDPKKAVVADIPWTEGDGIEEKHVWFMHECCTCGLTHRVLMVVHADGIRQYWWTDNFATRKSRTLKGLHTDDRWSASQGAVPRE